ncbi:peptide-methionine (R)-S-oxide reductase MsrB [Jannaschia ovalis]|uniref:peptide-methionine (R)-S-oxide reductase n=1 Tax=Jannaschia ovalis TaxID=3038773 RepID=A0ABY8LDM7_9RHOB|nr:peptide-methionine (R)-S-oxide reductase MsrB [Jannaschia sp. GRR-S6-38]WGH79401.1 peptide-methionine (R)-S-oxide reductase MsrB [Jannaschia sp. GRR-S6-38]
MPTRRAILIGGAATALVAGGGYLVVNRRTPAGGGTYPVTLTPEEWRDRLTAEEFAILREAKTERPYSSPLDDFWEAGTYNCAGCANPVYPSDTKFDSGTGWPSFWAPLSEEAIGTSMDYKLVYPRVEVHCANCGGHLGHVFDDGPSPTGKRHCLNGVALDFVAAETS